MQRAAGNILSNTSDAPGRTGGRASDKRRILAAGVLAALLGGAGWVAAGAARAEPMTVGATLPAIGYRTAREPGVEQSLGADPSRATILMVFHSGCGHCHYQLDTLEREVARLAGTRVLLVTGERTLPVAEMRSRWPGLASSADVTWATVNPADVARTLGANATPAFFVFGRDGVLIERFVGVAKVDYLLGLGAGA